MDARVRGALVAVTRRLSDQGVPFALGGSGLLWAHGLTDTVRDLDLVTEADAEGPLRQAVAEWVVDVSYEGTELWASRWIARLDLDGVEVDAIGGMALRHPGGVAEVPARAATRVTVDQVTVPVADPAMWWAVYRRYKPAKASLLERIVDAEARERVLAELGLD